MLELSHKKLDVYQISLNLIKEVYKATASFPKEEQYVLVSQIRRAVISVSSNIAEGACGFQNLKRNDFMKYQEAPLLKWIHSLK